MIKIGIGGLSLSKTSWSGISRYIWEVSTRLDRLLPDAEFYLYTNKANGITPISNRWTIREEPVEFLRGMKSNVWLKTRCGYLAKKDGIDVFWSATGLSPILPRSIPICMTVYDLNILIVPDSMARYARIAHNLFFEKDVRRADSVLALSDGTAHRLKEHFNLRAQAVAPGGTGAAFYMRSDAEIRAVVEKYDLKHPFCMAVGTIEPRKNLFNLLKAFNILDQQDALNGCQLVLVGKLGWKTEHILPLLEKFEGRWLRRIDFVADDELASLYSATDLFVMPSLYEGQGLPMCEARACGAPVAVTDTLEFRGNAGPYGIYIPGTSAEVIAEALRPALQKFPHRYVPLPEDMPSWDSSAKVVADALVSLVRKK